MGDQESALECSVRQRDASKAVLPLENCYRTEEPAGVLSINADSIDEGMIA